MENELVEALKQAREIAFGNPIEKPLGYYMGRFILSGFAILLSLWHHSRKRNPESPNTPKKFSWWFLIWDNTKRAGATLIVMFFLFRVFDLNDPKSIIGVGLLVPFALDKIIERMMSWSDTISDMLGKDRDKFPQKPVDNENG